MEGNDFEKNFRINIRNGRRGSEEGVYIYIYIGAKIVAALMNGRKQKTRGQRGGVVSERGLSPSVRVISEHWLALTFRQGSVTNTLAGGSRRRALTRQLAAV